MKTKNVAVAAALTGAMALTVSTAEAAVGHQGTSTATAAVHTTPGLTPQAAALMKAQGPLISAANRLQKMADADPASGWAGATIDAADGKITVYWHGSLPAIAESELASDRAAGLKVEVAAAAANRKDFQKEIDRLLQNASTTKPLSSTAPVITGMGVASDFTGITVGISQPAAASMTDSVALTRTNYPVLSTAILPLNFATADAPVSDKATRQADTIPYYAGGQTLMGAGGGCTLGYSAWNGGQHGIMTAAHCGWDDFRTGANVSIGRTSKISYSYDEQFIPTNSGVAVWDGTSITDASGAGQFSKVVDSTSGVFNGQWLCMSGAYSGATCNIKVVSNSWSRPVTDADGVTRNATVWTTEKLDHGAAEGSGDSGGPVFSLTADLNRDIAVGLITAHDSNTNVSCAGVPTGTSQWAFNRTCGWRSYITSVTSAASALGLNSVGS